MNYIIEMEKYWSEIKFMNTPMTAVGGLAACVDQERNVAYLYGGMNQYSDSSNELYKFNLDTHEISKILNLTINDRINHKMFFLGNNEICIVAGYEYRNKIQPKTIELFIINLDNKSIEKINTEIPFRGQFGSTLNSNGEIIYLYNGFNNNDLYKINVKNKSVHKIGIDQQESRAGMVFEYIDDDSSIFVFSGFSTDETKATCNNDILLINTITNKIIKRDLCEPFGRSFSKSVVIEYMKKVLIFGGSPNGMESSGAFYFYDYKNNVFNFAGIQPIPGERVESAMIYSKKNKKVYIIGGLKPNEKDYIALDNIMILDLKNVPDEVWHGHP